MLVGEKGLSLDFKKELTMSAGDQCQKSLLLNIMDRSYQMDASLTYRVIRTLLTMMANGEPEKYRQCINILAQIFTDYTVIPQVWSDTARQLLDDTVHFEAWEGLEQLGLISHLFAIPLICGLLDGNQRVQAKAWKLIGTLTGIQGKASLLELLQNWGTFHLLNKTQDFGFPQEVQRQKSRCWKTLLILYLYRDTVGKC
ncbi:WD repeat-containing protein 87-like [Macrotis lagotis]|uniref:WD repeat-containing protein 87-like n=1 Tax=Macrotis lagotis TaxID=92651 RepID=UPI003D69DAD3